MNKPFLKGVFEGMGVGFGAWFLYVIIHNHFYTYVEFIRAGSAFTVLIELVLSIAAMLYGMYEYRRFKNGK